MLRLGLNKSLTPIKINATEVMIYPYFASFTYVIGFTLPPLFFLGNSSAKAGLPPIFFFP